MRTVVGLAVAAPPPVARRRPAHNGVVLGLLVLGFPFVLMGFMLFMARVEEPLTRLATERKVERFLDGATEQELNTFVREGTDSALRRFATRMRPGRRSRLNR